jgi:hypothetical protein
MSVICHHNSNTKAMYGNIMDITWYHNRYHMVSYWISHGIIIDITWYHNGYHMVSYWISHGIIIDITWYHNGYDIVEILFNTFLSLFCFKK